MYKLLINMNLEQDFLSDFLTTEVTVLPRPLGNNVFSLDFTVKGGAENGEFLYFTEVNKHKIKYEEDATEGFSWLKSIPFRRRRERLRPGDIVLAVDGLSFAGMRITDFYYRVLWQPRGSTPRIRFKIVTAEVVLKNLKLFLQMGPFPCDSMAARLYKEVQENVSNVTVPFTTRPREVGEVQGREYWFLSEEKREELDTKGCFLQTGQATSGYKYGLYRPYHDLSVIDILEPVATKKFLESQRIPSLEIPASGVHSTTPHLFNRRKMIGKYLTNFA